MIVNAYAAPSATEPLVPTTIERRDVGPHDVLIEIKYAGICHSDIHTVRGDWGADHLPAGRRPRDRRRRHRGRLRGHQAPGRRPRRRRLHGRLVPRVRELPGRPGAVLPRRATSRPTTASTATAPITQGGYSTHIVVDEDFVLRVPESIPFDAAAPLLCAGITTYSPLAHWNAGPGKKVAVVGLGGLGHMAVKIAHALGAEVTVLSPVAAQEGRRAASSAPTTTTPPSDPDTFEQLAEHAST